MEALKRKKRYKAKAPAQTIGEIKDIIRSELGLSLQETLYHDERSRFHSCRISIDSDGLGEFRIGTNGKGVEKNYALASAHGEFMERIQNNALLSYDWFARPAFVKSHGGEFYRFHQYLKDRGLLLKYNIAPDEKVFADKPEFPPEWDKLGIYENAEPGMLTYLPFYNVFKDNVTYIPASVISYRCTSNGMCAGNTPKEAMIQGICEIMERYALRLIFEKNLTLPTIPKELFRGNLIYNHIVELEESRNWSIEIKDCSCNIGLPAIGILIIDKSKTGYHFHIGADPSPITALERSITEIYQGRTDIQFHRFDIGRMAAIENNNAEKEFECSRTFVDSTGQFPLSILSSENSYEFSGFDENYGLSDDSDLRLLTGLIRKLGFEMLVRDVSFLGFPAYRIYIPGMSEIFYVFDRPSTTIQSSDYFFTAHNIGQATREETETLIGSMESARLPYKLDFLNPSDDMAKDYDLSMCILYGKVGNYEKSHTHLDKYIGKNPDDSSLFYRCLRDILYAKYVCKSKDNSFLFKLYDAEMIDKIVGMLEQDGFLELFNLSSCFDCETCKISDTCKLLNLIGVSKRIERVFEKHIPDQKDLAVFFS